MRPLALLVPALLITSAASAGVIRGTVRNPGATSSAPALNAYPGRANAMPHGSGPVRGRITDAIVYLTQVPAEAESALARMPRERGRLAQKNEAFAPRVVPVARGGSIDFPNLDPIYHNVFSLSPTKRFDLGKYRQGLSKAVVFDRPGLVKVYCDIHSNMEAFVLVLPNRAFVMPDADGAFALPDLPPGAYELRVWHPDLREIVRPVQIPASGDVRLDLSF
ncbi:MAG TPA: carboxypeptidase regulatory-like domain-containing protein [Candidatus Eisenbacteria bacterium]|nr:carboxypeptidase regulatory-like domain-containing protein [Candidatus Eisenbacteria bacterium]